MSRITPDGRVDLPGAKLISPALQRGVLQSVFLPKSI
jgi:hypothetical protein